VTLDPSLIRPAEVDHLIGDASRARTELGWSPEVDFESLVTMMVDSDLARHKERLAQRSGSRGE
jgi:GDPmannose 4,6-dehydratase